MITLDTFNKLSLSQRFEILGKQGVFLLNKVVKNEEYSLYSVNNFYVETLFDLNRKEITQIKSFSKIKDLDKYLNDIHL